MTIAIGGVGRAAIKVQLEVLTAKADGLDVAVSYIQVSGWKAIAPLVAGIDPRRIRIVCTDQMGITDPRAVRMAQAAGVQVQRYTGDATYHPKVYIAHHGKTRRYVLGSANLSASALEQSVEVVTSADDDGTLTKWFEDLFTNKSEPFSAQHLDAMSKAVAARVKGQLAVQSQLDVVKKKATISQLGGAREPLDTIFGALPADIGMLNFDHAGNNVRTLQDARGKLAGPQPFTGKVRSEFGMLGLAVDGRPTPLGMALSTTGTDADFADRWVKWLHDLRENEFLNSQHRLVRARAVLRTFWKMQPEVRQYFLDNAEAPPANVRPILQTIELLANVKSISESLNLDEVRQLSMLLRRPDLLPPNVRETVRDYLANKGTRGWRVADRRLIPNAWRKASA